MKQAVGDLTGHADLKREGKADERAVRSDPWAEFIAVGTTGAVVEVEQP